jgi:putative protease
MHIPELLAPAGSKESLMVAVENGADAVYLGGKLFSARQYASNFDRQELEQAIDYAHNRSAKAYVAVNTLIKESEIEEAFDHIQFLCNCGADAVIVQDLGVLKLLREELPGLPVHASTQMTIHNVEGAKFLKEIGVKRVVLARELSLDEIRSIKKEAGIEIETFIHGALCFSYSGQCLLSSMIGGRSGNRGYCAQPCRKKYRIKNIEGFLLSPKDLNMSEHIPALIEAGIDSFKIEGRMKRPEYVAGAVQVYRRLIDRYFKAPESFRVTEKEKHTLLQLFNRGFTTGYFFGNPGGKLMSRRYPSNTGTELGRVLDYDPGKKQMSISIEALLVPGDGIGMEGKENGFIVRSMYVDDRKVNMSIPGSIVKIPVEFEVSRGDKVFKTYDSQLMSSLEFKGIRKFPVKISFKAHVDEPAILWISDGENEVKIPGENVSRAESKPISKSAITEQIKKLGNTIFEAKKIIFEMDENIFVPLSEINRLRREGIAQLELIRSKKWKRQCKKPRIPGGRKLFKIGNPALSVNTGSIESFEAAVNGGADVIYVGEGTFGEEFKKDDYRYAIEHGRKNGASVFISTPLIVKNINDLRVLGFLKSQMHSDSQDMKPDGFLAANPGVFHHLHGLFSSIPMIIDYQFNVLNRLTLEYLLNFSQRATLSPELTLKEIADLSNFGRTECIVHGNFPLMVSEHGILKGLFPESPGSDSLKDERGFVFPVRNDYHGRTYIMNSRDLCMLEYVPDLIKAGVDCLRVEARGYDPRTTEKITRAYRRSIDKCIMKMKCQDFGEHTTGHYYRGV